MSRIVLTLVAAIGVILMIQGTAVAGGPADAGVSSPDAATDGGYVSLNTGFGGASGPVLAELTCDGCDEGGGGGCGTYDKCGV